MKLVIGLGNPGKKYAKTRHNIGYMALDLYVKNKNLAFKYEPDFEGFIAQLKTQSAKTIFLKPTTFMNLSGSSVAKVANYYNISVDNILVIVDDINIELGTIKIKPKGSAGGHNGLKDIIKVVKTEEFKRIRIGISKDLLVIDYVLSKFSKKEFKVLNHTFSVVENIIDEFVKGNQFEKIMTSYN